MSTKMIYVCDVCKKEFEHSNHMDVPLVQIAVTWPILQIGSSMAFNSNQRREACTDCFNKVFESLGIKAFTHAEFHKTKEEVQ